MFQYGLNIEQNRVVFRILVFFGGRHLDYTRAPPYPHVVASKVREPMEPLKAVSEPFPIRIRNYSCVCVCSRRKCNSFVVAILQTQSLIQ